MRIGVETTTLSGKTTGTGRYLNCLLEQLSDTPHEVLPLHPRLKGEINKSFASSFKKHWYRNYGLRKDEGYDKAECLIFPDYFMPPNTRKRSAIVIHDLSFISHPHFYSKKFVMYYTYQLRQTLKQKPVIAAVSNHTRKNINKYLGIKEENIWLLQGYSGFRSFNIKNHETRSKSGRPYLLFVGHLEPRKNLEFLTEGFLNWKRDRINDYKLLVVGELWIKSKNLQLIMERHKNHPDIEFTGYVNEEKLQKIYSEASGFVHASFEEGFGFPVLEAMHFGLPILCTQNIATDEISRPDAITINPYDYNSLQNGLDELVSLIQNKSFIKYNIPYFPQNMRVQLESLLEELGSGSNGNAQIAVPKAGTKEEAIEKTLVYSNIFNSGVRKDDLYQQIFDKHLDRAEIDVYLESLYARNLITFNGDEVMLINGMKNYYKLNEGKINENVLNKTTGFLNRLPFISLIAFSGGSAHYGPENHEDIDLFIVSKPNTVYLVYFLIHIYSVIFGIRDKLCANYLLDERNLGIKSPHDPYTAHQIISLSHFKNEEMLCHFMNQNGWIAEFFPNFKFRKCEINQSSKLYGLLKPLNKLLMHIYRLRYRKRFEQMESDLSLMLSEQCIKLHTNDHRTKILKAFSLAWKEYNKSYKETV